MRGDVDVVAEWSRRHGDYDVSHSVLVRGWLRLVHALAVPLVRWHVHPDAVSAAAVGAAAAATRSARTRPRLAAGWVLASVVLDGVDGAVAVQSATHTAHGRHVDRLGDRASDVLFVVALRRAGCPAPTAWTAAVTGLLFEEVRRSHRSDAPIVVTVGDRPGRVMAVVAGLAAHPPAGGLLACALTVVGLGQLAIHRNSTAK